MQINFKTNYADHYIMWKMSKYGVLSRPYFPKFGLKMEICSWNLCIQSEYRKIQTRKNSVFGHFSSSVYIYVCSKISIIDQHHKHILAGNLRIIRDNNLKKLSSKEPEYGENKTFSFGKIKLDIFAALNGSIETWCTKRGYDKNYCSKSNSRIHHLSMKLNVKESRPALKETIAKQHLKDQHFKYLIVWIYNVMYHFYVNDCLLSY